MSPGGATLGLNGVTVAIEYDSRLIMSNCKVAQNPWSCSYSRLNRVPLTAIAPS